ncbi:hypothetical protein LOCC1_G000806 [Lachnellula occidentalis]|uniref:Uncharacterized protein n=1 Tax=Lachnellula occidentalis TaxID=215460 RepID=A0A8H8S8N4_9HELO|nr:hypothetical protein LOCC1_G000806 [Lachnellula occidentalis]
MITSSSSFVHSQLAIYHNAIKSLIFSAAQILLAMAVYYFFSLIAAKAKAFTGYLMFMEDIIQKSHFIISKGFSGSSILVLCFAILYSASSLYGTLLWGFDAPGYVMQAQNVSASTLESSLMETPAYIVNLDMNRNNLANLDQEMPHMIGANLYKAGSNYTLTQDIDRGNAEIVTPSRTQVGGRIWLDREGLSVSPDTAVTVSYITDQNGTMVAMDCPVQEVGVGVGEFWNCTVNNTFVDPLLRGIIGQPEIHWDDISDEAFDSRYLKPNRQRNIWASFGQGGGTAMMKQMFTITKGTRRHTFIETTFRTTMLTVPDVPFSSYELTDLLKRTWSTNVTEQQAPILTRLSNSILNAQNINKSFLFGTNDAHNETTTQVTWEYLTPEVGGEAVYSLLRITETNITVVRSENILAAPISFAPCNAAYANIAYGGVVTETDCALAKQGRPTQFFGQVDTSAVLILNGLGDGRSNLSAVALDEMIYEWASTNSERMNDLLLARGYIVSIDPSLVTVERSVLKPAISYLQLLLCLLALVLFGIAWLSLKLLTTSHWSSSLLLNILAPMNNRSGAPGYVYSVPDILLQETGAGKHVAVNNSLIRFDAGGSGGQLPPPPMMNYEQVPHQPKDAMTVHEGEAFLPQYMQPTSLPKP